MLCFRCKLVLKKEKEQQAPQASKPSSPTDCMLFPSSCAAQDYCSLMSSTWLAYLTELHAIFSPATHMIIPLLEP